MAQRVKYAVRRPAALGMDHPLQCLRNSSWTVVILPDLVAIVTLETVLASAVGFHLQVELVAFLLGENASAMLAAGFVLSARERAEANSQPPFRPKGDVRSQD